MNFSLPAQVAQTTARHADWGYIATVAGLLFAAIQAHRYWRRTIRLEDELEAFRKDTAFTLDRFEKAFRDLKAPAAFVDRNSGRVAQATPGWIAAGLPGPGAVLAAGDEALAAAWAAIAAPDAEGQAAEARTLRLQGRAFRALPLAGPSLGLVLLQPE
jgi:hypothetical protein